MRKLICSIMLVGFLATGATAIAADKKANFMVILDVLDTNEGYKVLQFYDAITKSICFVVKGKRAVSLDIECVRVEDNIIIKKLNKLLD